MEISWIQAGDELPSFTTPEITAELIRRYAEASGDFNPIHIHPQAARKAGHPDVIAHGMWSMAQSGAALGRHHLHPGEPGTLCRRGQHR